MGVVNVTSQCGSAVLLHVAEGTEVLDALEMTGLDMLHHVSFGVESATLPALPPTSRHARQVGGDQLCQCCTRRS